jgi:beta-barrel assembly-enhancing protease
MKILRILAFSALILSGAAIITILALGQVSTPLKSSFVPLLQAFGTTTKSVNSALTRLLPVDAVDEGEFGKDLAAGYMAEYGAGLNASDPRQIRLTRLLSTIAPFAKKPFSYSVFLFTDYPAPNAFALPGGVILFTAPLLDLMKSDGEVIAILAHEMGHIELSHCFDAVRVELLSRKSGPSLLLDILNSAVSFLLSYSYSKTQENQADQYAFKVLTLSEYDPRALAGSLEELRKFTESVTGPVKSEQHADLFRDYFLSHPPLALRIEKYRVEAEQWWKNNSAEKRKP